MPSQRIKGQEVSVNVLVDGDLQVHIDSVKSCEVTFMFDLMDEGYIGETSQRYDAIFKGIGVKMEVHLTNDDWLDFVTALRDRAQRRAGAATRVDVLVTLEYPGGDLRSIGIVDVQFGEIPFNIGERSEYVTTSLDGQASEYILL